MKINVDAYQLGWLLGRLQGQADKATKCVETNSHALAATASKQIFDLGGVGDYETRAEYFKGYGAGYGSATK